MISKNEIETKAKEFEIHEANVERDYVFGWMIFGIFTVSTLKDSFFLKGGNALRKGYFKNTRFSSDLDFGIPGDIAQNVLLDEINKVSPPFQGGGEGVVRIATTDIKEALQKTHLIFDKNDEIPTCLAGERF